MDNAPMWILAVLAVLAVLAIISAARYRRAYHRKKQELAFWTCTAMGPIRDLKPGELSARFREDERGTTLDSEVYLVGNGSGKSFSTSDTEAWVLSVLAKDAQSIFEFGTATGRTAYLMARNSSPETRVVTLTLGSVGSYRNAAGDSAEAHAAALHESQFGCFLYEATPVASKIEQLYGDSKQFDETAWLRHFDMIFIDGSHAYSYVKSDTEKAFRMIKPGGVIIWHDYRSGTVGSTTDVWKYLNELSANQPLARVPMTSLVIHRSASD